MLRALKIGEISRGVMYDASVIECGREFNSAGEVKTSRCSV